MPLARDKTSPPLLTVAREWEKDSKPRIYNGLEPLFCEIVILFSLWGIAYPGGVMLSLETANTFSVALLVLCTLHLLLVSPRLHGDTLADWGLGSPRELMQFLKTAQGGTRAFTLAALAALIAAMLWFNYAHWPEVAAFFHLGYAPIIGLRESLPGKLTVMLFGGLLAVLFAGYAIRYDNFAPAFRTALWIALPLCTLVCLGALAARGSAAFQHANPGELLLHGFSYLFWGFLQQLLFSGYFCTRMRRAMASEPKSAQRSLACALGAAAVVLLLWSPGITWVLVQAFPAEISWSALPWLAVFSLPIGVVYGWYLGREPRRLLVATLVASFFAAIHLNSYGLVLGTFLLGIPLAYVFMEARKRNLVALATVHALLGATLHWLFSGEDTSQVLYIDYHVGPWSIKEPSWTALTAPGIWLAVYIALGWWLWRSPCGASNRPAGVAPQEQQ